MPSDVEWFRESGMQQGMRFVSRGQTGGLQLSILRIVKYVVAYAGVERI